MKKIVFIITTLLYSLLIYCGNSDMVQKGIDSQQDLRLPEINIKLGSANIPLGNNSSAKIVGVGPGSSGELTFTIENLGTADLILEGSPIVSISSENVFEFPQNAITQPESSIIPAGRNTTFTIVFSPLSIGTKTATVTILNNDFDESNYEFVITGTTIPAADFISKVRKGITPLTVDFSDESAGEITDWEWDFDGDGTIDSTEQNPTYLYNVPGTYSVVLTVTGPGGYNYKVKNNYVIAQQPVQHSVISEDFNGASSVYAADIDGDGDMDILGAAYDDNMIAWWANDGKGNFGSIQTIASLTGACSVYAADINKDGHMDVIAAGGNAVSYWINDGNTPTVGWSSEYHISDSYTNARSIFAADLDNDEDMDILGAAENASQYLCWWRNEVGTISTTMNLIKYGIHNSVCAAKIDSNDFPDVVASGGNNISWWKNSGDPYNGGWIENTVDNGFNNVQCVTTADVDGDGDNDIIGAASGSTNEIAWWRNQGNETFGAKVSINAQFDDATSVFAADLDADNDMDLIAAGANRIVWMENTDGTGAFSTANTVDSTFYGANSVYSADFDGDGTKDILGSGAWYAWTGGADRGSISWWKVKSNWYKAALDSSFASASCAVSKDMDGDGDMDIIASAKDDGIAWWENRSSDNYIKNIIGTDYKNTYTLHAADIDNDGDMDVLAALEVDGILWIENVDLVDGPDAGTEPDPGTGNCSSWELHRIYDLGGDYSVYAADINGDNILDVLGAAYGSGQMGWWKNDSTYPDYPATVWDSTLWSTGTGYTIKAAYIDNDNYPDIVVSSASGLIWWENSDGTGSFPNPTVESPSGSRHRIDITFTSAKSVYPVDIDNDDDIDLLGAADDATDEVALWKNDGSGTFSSKISIGTSLDGACSVSAADIDGDGDLDVIGAAKDDDKVYWWENEDISGPGTGDCSSWIEHPVITGFDGASSVFAVDIDDDGDIDIIATAENSNEVVIFENNML